METTRLPRAQRRGLLALALTSALTLALPAAAQSQTAAWPTRAVTIVVPFSPGGSTDILARLVAKHLGETLGAPFVVENKAGANGNLGAAQVASAPPDGQTLLFTTTGPLTFNQFIYATTPFDAATAFTPIVQVAEIPLLLATHPSLPVSNFAEFLAYAQANPGGINYSTAGHGSMGHLVAELLQDRTGIELTHVPYKGSAPAMNDLVAGVVTASFDLAPTYAQYVDAGRIKAIGLTTLEASPLMPGVPTLAEQGLADFQATGWNALVGPAGLPTDITERLNQAVNQYLESPAGRDAVLALGMQPVGGSAQHLAEVMAEQTATWQPIATEIAKNAP